jgi:transposase
VTAGGIRILRLVKSSHATHFGVWPNNISRLERGLKRDDTLAANYRRWLDAQRVDAA